MKRRFFAMLLSLAMLFTLAPTAFAVESTAAGGGQTETPELKNPATSGTSGGIDWRFKDGTLTISPSENPESSTYAKGQMADYTLTTENKVMHTTAPWKVYDGDIKSVIIEPGVTNIGSHAFFMCNNLESVSLPDGVTTIGDRAFWQTSLKNITIPASVTQIGDTIKEVFYQCYDLENITVASGNTAYQSVDGVLYTADGTTLIQYPQNKADTSYRMIDTATKIEFLAFNYTQNLKTIDFNNVTTVADKGVYGNKALEEIVLPKVTTIGARAFSGNKAVTSLTLQTVPTSVGENAFSSCTSLANVTLPDEMKELTNGMFAECTGLKSIQFPTQLTKIDYGCFDHAGLTGDLVIPESVTSIGNLAFRNCFGLISITVKGTPTFEGQGYAFQFCKNLLWMKADFNITKYFGGIYTPDQYMAETLEQQNSSWFTADGQEVNGSTSITNETTFYRWFTKKVTLNANGGENNGNIKEVYAFFAPALKDDKTITFATRYYVGQTNYIINVTSDAFTRDGYTFKEWTSDAAGEKPYEIGKYIYNYMPTELYAQWNKVISEDTYFVSPVIADQTYTGSALKPAVKVTKNGNEITEGFTVEYSNNTKVGTATATVKVGDTVIGTAEFQITKATPTISISADPATMSGSGTVKLTVDGVPTEGSVEVTCNNAITVTKNENGTFSATLPNATKTYTFTASYTGAENGNYSNKDAMCTVVVTHHSSSSSNPTYSVTTPSKSENGGVAVSSKNARKGDTVTVTVTPDAGYQLDKLTVTDKNGNVLKLTDKGDGKYSFTMPDGKVEIKAVFAKKVETSPFGDVSADAYYYKAVQWAQVKGITDGISSNLFGPKQPCTRSQIVTFLWRAAGSPEPKGTAAGMTDVVPGSYYAKAVAWAVENGITTGTAEGTFSPDATCTRAQAVTFLARAQNAKATGKTAFSDVPADSYFADAVAWAQANGVTTGTTATTFSPDDDCTRAQIVTFLYRANQGT